MTVQIAKKLKKKLTNSTLIFGAAGRAVRPRIRPVTLDSEGRLCIGLRHLLWLRREASSDVFAPCDRTDAHSERVHFPLQHPIHQRNENSIVHFRHLERTVQRPIHDLFAGERVYFLFHSLNCIYFIYFTHSLLSSRRTRTAPLTPSSFASWCAAG